MRSRSSAVNRFIFARLASCQFLFPTPWTCFLTDSGTILALVVGSGPESLERGVLGVLRLDELAWQTRSLRNEFVGGLDYVNVSLASAIRG